MTVSRQETFAGTKEVEAHLQIDAVRLHAYLERNVPEYLGPLSLKRFKGGQSNPTYQLVTPTRNYVLRRKPPGVLLPSAHAVDREFRVIKALFDAGFPVPRPFVLCEDPAILGTIFYVMEMVEGRVLWEMGLPGMTPRERAGIYDAMVSTLAQLQQLDPTRLGLADFGKPTDYFARQIARWGKTYVSSETTSIPDMDKLNAWLPAHIPPNDETSLVHGDYRMDNMIMHPTEPRVVAVLDWELSTLGHPLGDFTYHLLPWLVPTMGEQVSNLGGLDLAALGIPRLEQYIVRYCTLTGRSEIPHLEFYSAYTVWRVAAIYQGIIKRVVDGTAASADAPKNTNMVAELAAIAWSYAVKAGAK
ncbi:MAG: phosphotransferase family protein [Gammaproteobacteria bacterium]|nr:phosphotransferase family protein [Gammaproteobacteria bacterium]